MNASNTINKITLLIQSHKKGNTVPWNQLFEDLYPKIKLLASHELNILNPSGEVSPTILVNECYLKLCNIKFTHINDSKHFYRLVAKAMRYYLIDLLKSQLRKKRNREKIDHTLSQVIGDTDVKTDLLDLDQAINKLATIDEELAKLTEMRFFSGLSLQQIANLYDTNLSHIYCQWKTARALLLDFLK